MDVVLALLESALKLLPPVVVVAPIIALAIDLAKKYLNLADGKAGIVSLVLNGVFWVVMFAAGQLGIDAQAAEFLEKFAAFAPTVVALIVALVSSKAFHDLAVKLGIGFAHPKPVGPMG